MDDTDGLVPALKGAADELYATVRIVDADDWDHGDAKGVCPTHWPSSAVATSAVSTPSNDTRTKRPSVRTRDRPLRGVQEALPDLLEGEPEVTRFDVESASPVQL